MTNRDRLILIGRALYGERWQRAVAADLGLDEKQVRRWATGEYEPPNDHVRTMRRVCEDRIETIGDALQRAFGSD